MLNLSKQPFYILPRSRKTLDATTNNINGHHCDLCDKVFKQSGHLDTHKKLKHSDNKVYCCKYDGCSRRFAVKWALRTHMKVHMTDKQFKCHLCDKSFHQKVNLKTHMDSIHNKLVFKCDRCSKEFKNHYQLKYHKNDNKCNERNH